MMMKYDTATPYIASYIVIRKDAKVAFVLRANTSWMNDYYGLPSGKTEQNESFLEGAIREAKEEIGITVEPTKLRHVLTMHRKEPSDVSNTWVDVFFEADTWEGEPYNAEPHMHSTLDWLDPKNLPDNVIPSVKFAIEQINTGNVYCEYGWN